jgi:hypothetical protein
VLAAGDGESEFVGTENTSLWHDAFYGPEKL